MNFQLSTFHFPLNEFSTKENLLKLIAYAEVKVASRLVTFYHFFQFLALSVGVRNVFELLEVELLGKQVADSHFYLPVFAELFL